MISGETRCYLSREFHPAAELRDPKGAGGKSGEARVVEKEKRQKK